MLTSYPKSLSMDALTTVADAARKLATGQGAGIDRPHALRACWDLQGYGQSLWQPDEDGGVVFGAATGAANTDDLNRLADQLDEVKRQHPRAGKVSKKNLAALNLDWKTILKSLLPLILALLG